MGRILGNRRKLTVSEQILSGLRVASAVYIGTALGIYISDRWFHFV